MEKSIAEIHEKVFAHLIADKKLRFTLRVRNRAERMDQGYWFTGNDNYLAFSFWKGLDWRNKTPNIYFQISQNGSSTIEFVSYDDEKKNEFFSEVAEALGMKQIIRSRTDEPVNLWVKNYKGTDYLAALDTFLKQDKKIIDAFIKSREGMEAIFADIDETSFETAKKKIENARKKFKTKERFQKEYNDTKSIQLQSLTLKNISLFADEQTISFHPNLTCFIGLNGTGKTSILRALVLAFSGYEQNETIGVEDNLLLTSKLRNLMRISGINPKNNTPAYPEAGGFAEVSYRLETIEPDTEHEEFRNRVLFSIENTGPAVSDDSNSEFRNLVGDRYKSLFLAFPQLLGESPVQIGPDTGEKEPNAGDAISMLNNQPDNRFNAFANWLRGLNHVANDKHKKGDQNPKEQVLLNSIFSVISEVTGETILLEEIVVTESGNNPIWVKIGDNSSPILFELVSQGYNNVFGWIGFFMKRLVEVTHNGADFSLTPAIVLIDEIDTYLHPKWQSKILEVLVRRFPNVQFVVTTHSPYVVGSVPKNRIKVFICKLETTGVEIEEFTEFTPYGADLDRLSEKVFGVKGRFVENVAEKLAELSRLINTGKLDDAKAFLKEKFADIDENDPELNRSKNLIRTKEILAK